MKSLLSKSMDRIVIAEVGQNHQGDIEIAKEYIRVFAAAGADVVKFQTRDNRLLFSEGAYKRPYFSENSFGDTYGAHRERLELAPEALKVLRDECGRHGVLFMSTPFDINSARRLRDVGVDALKLASFDLGNLPLIEEVASYGLPTAVSVGGGSSWHISVTVEAFSKYHDDLAVMHCVSEYPCPPEKLRLGAIINLKNRFPDLVIGSSDHFNGILSGPIAFMLGARVFEKHVTLNRSWKGTDHSFALEPEGFRKFVRDIDRIPQMVLDIEPLMLGEEEVFQRLGKSIVASRPLEKGSVLSVDDLSGVILDKPGVPIRELGKCVGRRLRSAVNAGDPIDTLELE